MRFGLGALLLPALVAAQAQKPLGEQVSGWWEMAKSYVPAAAANPVDAGAAVLAREQLVELTTNNWQHVLAPKYNPKTASYGPDTWMVLISGGNKTCGGRCGNLETEFNKTVATYAASKNGPRFGIVNCDNYAVLCSTWFAAPSTLWYIQRPQLVPGEPMPKTPIHVLRLNATEVKSKAITAIHKDNGYKTVNEIDSMFHPFDGQLAEYGLNKPLGYVLFLFSMIPSWSLMLGVSFLSRSLINKRVGNPEAIRRAREQAGQPLGGAPAAG